MTATTYTHCIEATGRFTDRTITAAPEVLALNALPAGELWIEGRHNPHTAAATFVTDDQGDQQIVVVEIEPTPPAETEWQSWRWNAASGCWDAVAKLKLLQANARPPVLAQLAALDEKVARPVGEIAQAQALGATPPEAAVSRLQAINDDKQLLRARLAAIVATTTPEELAALLAEPVELQTAGA